jgi:hypothetical protein
MSSGLFQIFFLEVVVRILNTIDAAALNEMIWTAINYLPVSTSKAAGEQRKLQAEYLKIRRELNATSSQDQFAKWAKLRRQHDKLLEQLEATKKNLDGSKANLSKYISVARFLLLRGPQFLLPFWYGKEPMFWLPHGWFPYWAEWFFSLPRAPLGSVSAASWQVACVGLVTMVADLISGIVALVGSGSKQKEAPVKGQDGKPQTESPAAKADKKEL